MANLGEISRAMERGPEMGGQVLKQLLEAALNGVSALPGAKAVAAKHLQRSLGRRIDAATPASEYKDAVDVAIDTLVAAHVSLAAAQGLATNIGGIVTAIVGLPANLAAVAVVQIRLIAAIAHLRGYDIDDLRVRTALTFCLMGESGVKRLVESGALPTTPMGLATAPVFDSTLDAQVTAAVFAELLSRIGGRRAAILIIRRIPLVGGGVSGAMDGWSTHSIGEYAREQFPARRHLTRG